MYRPSLARPRRSLKGWSVKYEKRSMVELMLSRSSRVVDKEDCFDAVVRVMDPDVESEAAVLLTRLESFLPFPLLPFQREMVQRLATVPGFEATASGTGSSRVYRFRAGPQKGQCSLLSSPPGTGKTLMSTLGCFLYTVLHQEWLLSWRASDVIQRRTNGLEVVGSDDRAPCYKNVVVVMVPKALVDQWKWSIESMTSEFPQGMGWGVRVEVLGSRSVSSLEVGSNEVVFALAHSSKAMSKVLGGAMVPCMICDEFHHDDSSVLKSVATPKGGGGSYDPVVVGHFVMVSAMPPSPPSYRRLVSHQGTWELVGSRPRHSSLWERALGLGGLPRLCPSTVSEGYTVRMAETMEASMRSMARVDASWVEGMQRDVERSMEGMCVYDLKIRVHCAVDWSNEDGVMAQLSGKRAFRALAGYAKSRYGVVLPESFDNGWTSGELCAFLETCENPLAKAFLCRLRVEGKACSICLETVSEEGVMLSCCMNVMHSLCHRRCFKETRSCPLCRHAWVLNLNLVVEATSASTPFSNAADSDEEEEEERSSKRARARGRVPGVHTTEALVGYVRETMGDGSGNCTLRVRLLVLFEALVAYAEGTGARLRFMFVGRFGINGFLVEMVLDKYLLPVLRAKVKLVQIRVYGDSRHPARQSHVSAQMAEFNEGEAGKVTVLVVRHTNYLCALTGLDAPCIDGIISAEREGDVSTALREGRVCRLGRKVSPLVISFVY